MDKATSINNHSVAMGSLINGEALNGHSVEGLRADDNSTNSNGLNSASTNGYQCHGQAPIAICGMACRLPGGLMSPEELWEFLLAKKDGRCRVPASRYNISSYCSAHPKPGMLSTEYGYFLDERVDLGALDTSFFSLPRSELERADPQQRILLEVAQEAFQDAGMTNWRGKNIGCYIGNFGEDWLEMLGKETQPWGIHRIAGSGDWAVSNRLSYEFDIKGPRFVSL